MPKAGNSKFRKVVSGVLTALAVLMTAALIILGLLVRVKLTEQNNENVALKKELDALEDENTRLRIRYESLFDVSEIEEYAEDVLGMKRADSGYYEMIDTPVHDKAVIIDKRYRNNSMG